MTARQIKPGNNDGNSKIKTVKIEMKKKIDFNPFKFNGIPHPYNLHESISSKACWVVLVNLV